MGEPKWSEAYVTPDEEEEPDPLPESNEKAEVMKNNPDIREAYLGGAEGRDFKEIKHYRRRKRWLA